MNGSITALYRLYNGSTITYTVACIIVRINSSILSLQTALQIALHRLYKHPINGSTIANTIAHIIVRINGSLTA